MRLATALGALAACTFSMALTADDHDGDQRRITTVDFGAGLNTAQPGNSANHHVIPDTIKIHTGDIVNFTVSGLHVIRVYAKGVALGDVKAQIPDECEVNPVPPATFPTQCNFSAPVPVIPAFGLGVYYEGINPLAAPPPAPPFAQLSATLNRVETVTFPEAGKYLVICAVLEHFNDKMYAVIEVRDDNDGHHH